MLMWDQIVDFLRLMIFSYAQACGGNLGAGILATSVVMRIVMFPLTLRIARVSLAHQQAMAKLQPELERIRKKFRKRPDRIAEETRKLFDEHGVSPLPLGGCLGGLVQLPLFVALYSAIQQVVAAGGRFLWIRNIAKPDVCLTIVVAAITSASVVYSASTSQQGNRMFLIVPVVVTVMVLVKASAGIGIYWGVSAAASLIQSRMIRTSASLGKAA